MKLLHYIDADGVHLATQTGDGVFELAGELEDVFAGNQPERLRELNADKVRFAPCVPRPGKIVCVGLNYRKHAAESGADVPTKPIIFSKFNNALAASGDEIPLTDVAVEYDYEAELVVVIGQKADGVSESDAFDHVWGYCNGNDLSARDLQTQSSQWLLGKSLTRSGPIGPWLVSRDEAGELGGMRVTCTVNGDLRQDSSVGDMVFGVPELVSFISRHIPLDPGDLIFTGTPEGVADGRPDQPWLKPGDEVVVEVGELGRLVNRMVAAD
jgi:2-keto-4-pentenoate hydratase/2-oxohepta-3-ene-1,7-dioic acid hydratase in catechol pathway